MPTLAQFFFGRIARYLFFYILYILKLNATIYAIKTFKEGNFSMNKTELINALAEETKVSKKDTGAVLDAFVKVVTEEL